MLKHQLQILVHVVFFILSHILPTFKETRVIVDVGTSRKFQFDIRNAKSEVDNEPVHYELDSRT